MSRTAMEYFNLSEKEMDRLIQFKINEGWIVSNNIQPYKSFFIPPDDRINWAASWYPYKDILIPHWITGEYTK